MIITHKNSGNELRNLSYKKKYKVTTNSEHNKPVYQNELKQNFKFDQPNQAWVGDITYSVPGVQH
jgi:transposase InsO family protein